MNKDKTLNRDQIESMYIEWYIEGSSLEDLQNDVRGTLLDDLSMLDDVELLKEVKRYAPGLVPDNITLSIT